MVLVILYFHLIVNESFKEREDGLSNLQLHISEFLHMSVRCDIVYVINCICVFQELTEKNQEKRPHHLFLWYRIQRFFKCIVFAVSSNTFINA